MPKGKPKNSRHPNFKGGRLLTAHGYIIVFVGRHYHLSDCRGYAYEHRIVAEQKIGRKLKKGEHVHHIDGNKQNNSIDNIDVLQSLKHHLYKHRKKDSLKRKPDEENIIVICECGCGKKFLKYDQSNRPRRFISGHNLKYNGKTN